MQNKKFILSLSLLIMSVIAISNFVIAEENTTIAPNIVAVATVTEQVKCVFDNSDAMQTCYTYDGRFGCSGIGTCIADVSGEEGKNLTWKSSCGGYDYTIVDGNNEYAEFTCASSVPSATPAVTTSPQPTTVIVGEQVKCVFDNSNVIEKCYTVDDKFRCSGIETCVADVSGKKGEKLTWKSTCGGYAYTITDGDSEYAEFSCVSSTTSPQITPVIVAEQVTCLFQNSATEQKCYTAEDNSIFSCIGTDNCTMDVSGKKGEKLTWKSTCGGYAYSFTEGNNEYIKFNCIPKGNTTKEMISGKGFRYAYWQCYNGKEQKQGSESSCKSSETWQSYAKEFCKDKCYEDKSKCGVNSFSVTENCYLDVVEESFLPSVSAEESIVTTEAAETTLICSNSCPLGGKCYPFGYRKSGQFCSDTGSFIEQSAGDAACDNNFECSSNVCVSGTCVSEGVLKKILNWFKNLFG